MIVRRTWYHVIGSLKLPFLARKPAANAASPVLAGSVTVFDMAARLVLALVHVHAHALGAAGIYLRKYFALLVAIMVDAAR